MTDVEILSAADGDAMQAFAAAGQFYKGNLHTHSNRSDGALEPEEVCARYRARGYDFIALTDHFIGAYGYPITDTLPYRTNAFTTVLGAEVHTGKMANGELWHLLAVGLPPEFAPPHAPGFSPVDGAESAAGLTRRAVAAGAFVAIAHPQWSGLTLEDAMEIDAAHAVEIYNHGCAVDSDRPDGTAMLDLLLSNGRRLTACATDDAHDIDRDAFGGWVQVKSESLAPEALVAALRNGDYYASQGPVLTEGRINAEMLTLVAEKSGAPMDRLVLMGPGSASAVAYADQFEEREGKIVARIPLGRCADTPWLRASLIDIEGRRAWTNPIWR
ncbi:MAG: CehA/McbA family metallohydrolase [Neomegalonema sp.]|nr:CehA/McbA family metallohydrolase [Neomegalonema sp.]